VAMILFFIASILSLASPFLVHRLIEFIMAPDISNYTGTAYVILLVVTQLGSSLLIEHVSYYSRMIGVRSTNALISLIYKKQLRVSGATNKGFSQGEIVNFVQVDSQKLSMISENIAGIA